MKAKKLLALALTLCLAFSCIAVIPFTATVASADGTPTATAGTKAIYVGPGGYSANNQQSAVFYNISKKTSSGYTLEDGCYVRFSCKVKMLAGSKPIIGFVRECTQTWTNKSQTCVWTDWARNSDAHYDATTGEFYCDIYLEDIPGDSNTWGGDQRSGNYRVRTKGSNGTWGSIVVGNCNIINAWPSTKDFSDEFIFWDAKVVPVKKKDGTALTCTDNLIGDVNNYNDQGVYGWTGVADFGQQDGSYYWKTGVKPTSAANNYMNAPKDKWSNGSQDPGAVKLVTVDNDLLTANRTYEQHVKTAYTREYYTCSDFGDVKFEKVGTGCYSKISNDVNLKSIVIGNDGTNKVANIFMPLDTHRYFQRYSYYTRVNGSGSYHGITDAFDNNNGSAGANIYYHISFNAKRISGSGQPVLGRMYCADWDGTNDYTYPGTNAAYNNTDTTAKADLATSSYNPTTGEFTAIVRFNKGYYYQMTRNGYNEILTIGNTEHSTAASGNDANSMDSAFIISDISIQVYDSDNTTLVCSEAAPELNADNINFINPDVVDDHSSQHMWKNGGSEHNGRQTALYDAPLDKWTAEGAIQQIKAINKNACNIACHSLVHHNADADAGTRDYYECKTCSKAYEDKYASKECDNIYETRRMIAVKASGSTPGNAFVTIDNPTTSGTHYYMFTCDMRIFGNDVPTISAVKGSWWGGNGAQSDNSWVNNSEEPNDEGLCAYYDSDSNTYTAIFKVVKENSTSLPSNYYNAVSGAYAAFILGNGAHVGANGYENTKYFTSFIFGNPQIVELSDPEDTDSVIGENICPTVSDKTLNFTYSYSGEAKAYYNTENTMYRTNNILSAPVGKWNVDGSTTWVKAMDIPAETFFTEEQGFANQMLRVAGSGPNYNMIDTQLFLKPGVTYQFDIDYREFGSAARIKLEHDDGTNSYSNTPVALTATSDNVDGAHKSVRFTMPAGATNKGDGNFRIWLGQNGADYLSKNTTTVYYANAQIREVVDDAPTGANLFLNGSFDFGGVGDITAANANVKMFGWEIPVVSLGGGKTGPSLLNFSKHDLMSIPTGFFTGDIGNNNLSIRFDAKDWAYIRTAVDLEPDATYELSYNYRATDDDIEAYVYDQSGKSNTYTRTLVSNHTSNKFTKTYRITTAATNSYSGSGNANTIIEFRCQASSDGNKLYINNIQLHKVVNNQLVGMNMIGDRNAIYDDMTYYPSNENDVTLATNPSDSALKDRAHSWWSTKAGTTASVVRTSEHFYDYYAPAERVAKLVEVLINKTSAYNPYTDETNPYYNPDKDTNGTTNILDLIKVKKDITNISDNGGAGAEANSLLTKIMNAQDVAQTGTVKKIAKTDSVATLVSTLKNATGGTKVLLERGGEWRLPSGQDPFTVQPGVTLGAYGTGAKPILNGSQKNYASVSWSDQGNNIWRYRITSDPHDANLPGTVYFFNNATDTTPSLIGRVIKMTNTNNGSGTRFASTSELEKEGDVYYKESDFDGYIYVYSVGSPASKYGKIEIGEKRGVVLANGDGITIDNICVKYTGGHGINSTSRNNISVTNCEVAYIGGTPIINNGEHQTMGNGIQFGLGGSNLTINNCYVHDCYDAGITFQTWGSTTCNFNGVNFTNNLLTNNFYNIELFTNSNSTMKNIDISGNIMRFAGDSWSLNQRQDTYLRAANMCCGQNAYYEGTENFSIEGNIFDCTKCQQILWFWGGVEAHKTETSHAGVTIKGNSYYQNYGAINGRINRFGNVTNDGYDYAGSTSKLAAAIIKMDTNPAHIEWVNRTTKF